MSMLVRGLPDVAIYKLVVLRQTDCKLARIYSVSDTPYEVGATYKDTLNEVDGGWFTVMQILEVIPQRKDVI